MMMHEHAFHDVENVINYIFAGHATVTLKSEKTGKHFTYKITKSKNNEKIFFVSLLTGPDNTHDYQYLGRLKRSLFVENKFMGSYDGFDFAITKASVCTNETSPAYLAFDYFINHLKRREIANQLSVYHIMGCGKCGRPLTDPESISRGLGKICAEKLGVL